MQDTPTVTPAAIIHPIPAVGMIVLFVAHDELLSALQQGREHKVLPAIITEVHPQDVPGTDRLDLAVFDPNLGYTVQFDVRPYSPTAPGPGWHWMPPIQYPV